MGKPGAGSTQLAEVRWFRTCFLFCFWNVFFMHLFGVKNVLRNNTNFFALYFVYTELFLQYTIQKIYELFHLWKKPEFCTFNLFIHENNLRHLLSFHCRTKQWMSTICLEWIKFEISALGSFRWKGAIIIHLFCVCV